MKRQLKFHKDDIKLKKEINVLKKKFKVLNQEKKRLEFEINKITSTKVFKIWHYNCQIINKITGK